MSGSENGNVPKNYNEEQVINGRSDSSISIPLSVQNGTENDVVSSQQKHDLKQYSSISRTSSIGASMRRLFTLGGYFYTQMDENAENEMVSQAGDIGDRELSRGGSQRASLRFPTDQRVAFPFPEDLLELELYDFWPPNPSKLTRVFPGSPFSSELASPLPTDPVLQKEQEEEKQLPPSLAYVSCLVYLGVFAILGVLSRYLLQKLFGPNVAGVTTDNGILYINLPSNMVGSFLMGWLGVVFRGDISCVSDQLAIGLTTGYLGSLTAFSGWNQNMLELSVRGDWLYAVLGFVVGLFLSGYSIIFGIESAKGFRWLLRKTGICFSASKFNLRNFKRHLIVLILLILIWGGLWIVIGILAKKEFNNGDSGAQLWVACFVGPFGVWMRWLLARMNGHGLGKAGRWKWIPFGTLIANISGAVMMAVLAIVKKAVNTKNCDTIATGLQFGFVGCLSTVPAFMAEFNAMRQSSNPWRAYAYAMITIVSSFGLGTLIYSVPVWLKGYN